MVCCLSILAEAALLHGIPGWLWGRLLLLGRKGNKGQGSTRSPAAGEDEEELGAFKRGSAALGISTSPASGSGLVQGTEATGIASASTCIAAMGKLLAVSVCPAAATCSDAVCTEQHVNHTAV